MQNSEIAQKLEDIARLLDIKSDKPFRIRAYRKAAEALRALTVDVNGIYQKDGITGITNIPGVGKSIATKIEEFLKENKSEYLEKLDEDTAIRQVVTFFFETKGVNLDELKRDAKKRDIVYSRYTKPAKQLIELAGSVPAAKDAIKKVADWANSRKLDYAIETVFKKWLEIDRLRPKEVVKKPFYRNDPMIWSETRKKWYVVTTEGEWLEYADKEEKIEWRIVD
ncbi:MAG: helix-hairpin-helix domain-containing protein [Candidatus Pacebacteria bacterium]|nr:helix-hairpin-helix domain-containing protein [Candidatus Paceibacterota bacterium]